MLMVATTYYADRHMHIYVAHTQVYSIVYMHMHTYSVYIYTIYTSYIIHMFAKAGSRSD